MARGFNASSTSLKPTNGCGPDGVLGAPLHFSFRATGWECSDSIIYTVTEVASAERGAYPTVRGPAAWNTHFEGSRKGEASEVRESPGGTHTTLGSEKRVPALMPTRARAQRNMSARALPAPTRRASLRCSAAPQSP